MGRREGDGGVAVMGTGWQFHGDREVKGWRGKSRGSKTDWANNHLLRDLLEETINKSLATYFLTLSGGRYTIIPITKMNEINSASLRYSSRIRFTRTAWIETNPGSFQSYDELLPTSP